MEVRQSTATVLTRFGHVYYLLRLLACFPALLHLLALPTTRSTQQQLNFLSSSQIALTIPLIAIPVLVLARLTQLKKSFNLLTLSLETLLDTWLVHFLAFNFGSLALLGGWIPATTYLACLISFGVLCPKPAYLGPSNLRVMDPETFTTEILNRTYSSVTGFSASELLNLTTEKLTTQLDNHQQDRQVSSTKKWIIWPLSEARKRSHVGFMDMEVILANLSLEFGTSSDEREFLILDMKNTTSLTYTLKIWSEDDSASSPVQPDVDALVLLEYQAGREINRLPARQLVNDVSSDEEEDSAQDSLSNSTVVWSQVSQLLCKTAVWMDHGYEAVSSPTYLSVIFIANDYQSFQVQTCLAFGLASSPLPITHGVLVQVPSNFQSFPWVYYNKAALLGSPM